MPVKVKWKDEDDGSVVKKAEEILPGTLFAGRIGVYNSRLFIRLATNIVALDGEYAGGTWTGEIIIHDFCVVENITVDVKKPVGQRRGLGRISVIMV